MRAIVPIKRVIDYAVKVRLNATSTGVDTNVKMSMNPFCEIAVEEAIRLKEKGLISEIVVVSIGPTQCQETLRQALAMGADRAVLIKTSLKTDTELQPLAVAKVLQSIVNSEQSSLVLMGKQSIDGDNNQTGQMLAGLLGWSQATFASAITFKGTDTLIVDREVDTGIQTISVKLPAVVTADLRLNEPRFATLPNLMKAKKKPMDTIDMSSLNIDTESHVNILKMEEPPVRKGGRKLENVDQLIAALKAEAKVL